MKGLPLRRIALLAVVAAALLAPASAGAQAPLTDGYGPDGGVLNEVVGGGGGSQPVSTDGGGGGSDPEERRETGSSTPSANASAGGSLPFTGLDLGLLIGGGLSMLVLGVTLRRMSRSTS